MIKFRLGSVPVEIHFSHLMVSGLLAIMSSGSAAGFEGWPGSAMKAASDTEKSTVQLMVVLMWMGIITFSVLVHEFGHAIASRVFGYRPSIHLMGLGGITQPNANEDIPWHKDVLLTLAGPGAGLLLAGTAGVLLLGLKASGGSNGPLGFALSALFFANLVWAMLNLLPIPPLDGGRISSALLMRVLGRKGFLIAQVLGLIFAGVSIAWGVAHKDFLVAVMFGTWAARAVSMISAYNKGEQPPHGPQHPFARALLEAETLYTQGKYDKARQICDTLMMQELQPPMRAQVHHRLGWLSLKEGKGRAALDHFSQVQGFPVAPHGLAAAFSLVGDDFRAGPLWEMAVRAAPSDPLMLHEYAGTLVRLNKTDDARRLPGVRMVLAFQAAERVHFLRNEFVQAGAVGEAAFQEEKSPEIAYDAACAYAKGDDATSALRMLNLASQSGFAKPEMARWDSDLVALRGNQAFEAWLRQLEKVPRA